MTYSMSKINYQKFFYPVTFLILFISACDDSSPVPEEKFIKVFADVLIAKDTIGTDQISADSLTKIILKNNNLTLEEYKQTINFYNSSPERWEDFFNKAGTYVEELRETAETNEAALK